MVVKERVTIGLRAYSMSAKTIGLRAKSARVEQDRLCRPWSVCSTRMLDARRPESDEVVDRDRGPLSMIVRKAGLSQKHP